MELEESREPVYKLTLELANGVIEQLNIYLDSDPEELAFNFSKQKNLDFTAMNYLLEEIKRLMKRLPGNSDKNKMIPQTEEISPVKSEVIQHSNNNRSPPENNTNLLIDQIRQEASQYNAKPMKRPDGINYGERLYQKGLKMRQLQKINREQRNKESSSTTSIPKISKDSIYYVNNY
jgi:hypothetical protein